MKGTRFALASGYYATFFTDTFVIIEEKDGGITIDDLVHGNGGWKLARTYTYDTVMAIITKKE